MNVHFFYATLSWFGVLHVTNGTGKGLTMTDDASVQRARKTRIERFRNADHPRRASRGGRKARSHGRRYFLYFYFFFPQRRTASYVAFRLDSGWTDERGRNSQLDTSRSPKREGGRGVSSIAILVSRFFFFDCLLSADRDIEIKKKFEPHAVRERDRVGGGDFARTSSRNVKELCSFPR